MSEAENIRDSGSSMGRWRIMLGPVTIILGLTLLAFFMRIYRLEIVAYNPDTYEQLAAAKRLIAADLPISKMYPPGIAVIMAPPLAFLPQTLVTMQVVIVISSVALVALSYFSAMKLTADHAAAVLLALALTFEHHFVYFSRVGLFDVIGTLGVVLSVSLLPMLRGRGPLPFIAYGVLVSLLINIRITNAVVVPALLIYWVAAGHDEVSIRAFWRELRSWQVILVSCVIIAVCLASALAGGWMGTAVSAPVTLDGFPSRVLFYAIIWNPVGAVTVLPLCIVGAVRLWRVNRAIVFAGTYIMLAWLFVHAFVAFVSPRYMLPALYFALFFAAHGAAGILRDVAHRPRLLRYAPRSFAIVLVILFGAYEISGDTVLLYKWPERAAEGDEAAYRELRPVVASLPSGALLVTTQSLGVREANHRIDYLDLIDHLRREGGNGPRAVQAAIGLIEQAQHQGRDVFYLYSDFEADAETMGRPGPGFDQYFAAVQQRFITTEVFRASLQEFRIFKVSERPVSGRQGGAQGWAATPPFRGP